MKNSCKRNENQWRKEPFKSHVTFSEELLMFNKIFKVAKYYEIHICFLHIRVIYENLFFCIFQVFSNETNFCTNTTNLENGATASRGMMMKKESRVVLYGMQLNSEISPEAYLFTRITNILPWILNTLGFPRKIILYKNIFKNFN